MLISLLATAVTSGAVGYWLGRRRRDPEPVTVESSKVEPQDEQALWMLRSKADCSYGLRRENLIVSIGGDLLSPYPLSTLDKGRGMVDVMLESGVQFACFGNHEADVGLPALKKRLERWHERGGVWINTNMPDLLPELQLPSYASKVDAVVALTHQDLEVDIELAKKATAAGIYAAASLKTLDGG
eukprot:g12865.t1